MLLVEMLLARLLCEFKMLGGFHRAITGSCSSGVVTADHRSRADEGNVDDRDDVDEVAKKKTSKLYLGLCTPTNADEC